MPRFQNMLDYFDGEGSTVKETFVDVPVNDSIDRMTIQIQQPKPARPLFVQIARMQDGAWGIATNIDTVVSRDEAKVTRR